MTRDNLRNDWEAIEVNLTELSLKGNVFNRKNALIVDGTFSFPRCTVNQPCFLLQSLKKQVLNTVVNGHKPKVNGHKPNYKKIYNTLNSAELKKLKW